MKKSCMLQSSLFSLMLPCILCMGKIAVAQSPVLYHESFNTMDFLKEDIVEHANFDYRTAESRKLSTVAGRFGKALHLGNPTTPYPYDRTKNKTLAWSVIGQNIFNNLMDLKGYRFDANGPNWSGPFLWATEKINPSSGSVSFWIHGKIKPKRRLFFQTTASYGRTDMDLIVVRIDRDSRLSGYLVDARYDRHEITSSEPVTDEGWKHIVFTWDMTSGLELYLNGEQVASSAEKDAWWMVQLPGILHIPSDQYTIDELYIVDRPLTNKEVRGLFTSNKPPENSISPFSEDSDAGLRLTEKSGISTSLNLPVATPSDGVKTLQFEEVWFEDIKDGKIPSPWLIDGAYWIAWPHPYAFWTTTIGDFDFHAEKIDIKIPKNKTVNYITLEGNLQGVKVHELYDEEGIETKTLMEVPPFHGFFYGSLITPVSGRHLRIPLVKDWGTPKHYKGDIHLPLTGDTRIHEIGFYNVTEAKQRSGKMFYISEKDPQLDSERWGFAYKTLPYKRDLRLVSAFDEKPSGNGSYFDTGTFRRLNIISQPWTEKGGIETICLNLYIKSRDEEDVLCVRLRDSGVPSRIWAHAEVKLKGFNRREPGLLSLTFDMTDLALAPGDRLWLDVCSASGTEILVGDKKKPSVLIVGTIPLKDALPEYSPKEIFVARASWWKHGELALWKGNVEADYLKPKAWCGNFNTVYPVQAVRRVEPDHEEAQYLWENANGLYSFYVLWDKENNTYYTVDTFPKSMIKELDVPKDVPAWAVYMKPYLEFREEMGNYWADRQNPDGQYGGGYNDDATELIGTLMDVPLNGNQKAINAVNKWRNLFDKTRILKDGYENVYPQDPHHTKDICYGVKGLVKINLGNAYRMEKAMEVAWHYGRPDRTPMHYAHGSPNFSYGLKAAQWYWGLLKPGEPYVGMNEEELIKHLKYWHSALDNTVKWYYKQDHEFGGINITGSGEFRKLFHGGDPKSDAFAVYWPNGVNPDIARVVDYADDTSFNARIYSFDDNERTLTARLCRLEKGKYSVTLAPDRDNDGEPDGNPAGKIMELRRFTDIDLTIPPQAPLALHIKQLERYGDPGSLPDLAVDPEDIRVSNNFVTVTVHNIGNAPADNIRVTLLVDGKLLETQTAAHIDAPVDLVPKFYTLYFMDFRSSGEVVEAVVDPDNAIEEIYERNNRSVAADCRGDNYFDWSDIPYVP